MLRRLPMVNLIPGDRYASQHVPRRGCPDIAAAHTRAAGGMAGGRFLRVWQYEPPGSSRFSRPNHQRVTAVGASVSARSLLAAKLSLKAGRLM